MKTRFKSSVVYHAEPEVNKCFLAKSEILENKLKKGTITKDELMKLASFRAEHKVKSESKTYVIFVWGKPIEVTKEEHDKYLGR